MTSREITEGLFRDYNALLHHNIRKAYDSVKYIIHLDQSPLDFEALVCQAYS
jgi:hypothetical protein